MGNGNGTFQPAANYIVAEARAGVLVAEDFTGDQITDLVTGNYDAGISFLRGNSDGTFLPALNSQSFPERAIAAGVLNIDSPPRSWRNPPSTTGSPADSAWRRKRQLHGRTASRTARTEANCA